MTRTVLTIAAAMMAAALGVSAVFAETRIALVVGNADYQQAGWELQNSVRDAQAVAARLTELGFDVETKINTSEDDLENALRSLRSRLRRAGEDAVGLFYFSGHGIQSGGVNWLLPVEVEARVHEDIADQGVRLGLVVDRMVQGGAAKSILIINACRNDPLPRATRSAGGRGMTTEGRQDGVLIAYAAAPGEVALDYVNKSDRLSPYASALIERLGDPEPAQLLFDRITGDVRAATSGAQRPFTESGLGARSADEDFYFKRPDGTTPRRPTHREPARDPVIDPVVFGGDAPGEIPLPNPDLPGPVAKMPDNPGAGGTVRGASGPERGDVSRMLGVDPSVMAITDFMVGEWRGLTSAANAFTGVWEQTPHAVLYSKPTPTSSLIRSQTMAATSTIEGRDFVTTFADPSSGLTIATSMGEVTNIAGPDAAGNWSWTEEALLTSALGVTLEQRSTMTFQNGVLVTESYMRDPSNPFAEFVLSERSEMRKVSY